MPKFIAPCEPLTAHRMYMQARVPPSTLHKLQEVLSP